MNKLALDSEGVEAVRESALESGILERDVLLCRIVASLGHIRGRKRFQKAMYIAKALGYTVPEEFAWGNYGVYSPELQWELDSLAKHGLVLERNVAGIGQSPEYEYALGTDGLRLLDKQRTLAAKSDEFDSPLVEGSNPVATFGNNEIEALVGFLRTLIGHPVNDLELWSSILYLRQSEGNMENLISFLRYLKPKYSAEDIRQGIAEVQELQTRSFQNLRDSRSGGPQLR